MKFLLDESVEYRLLSFLKNLDHDVTAIGYDYPPSLKDQTVLEIANNEKRVLITNDRDFGELIFRQHLSYQGVIFFRLKKTSIEEKCNRLQELLEQYANHLQKFLVVTEQGVRIREQIN